MTFFWGCLREKIFFVGDYFLGGPGGREKFFTNFCLQKIGEIFFLFRFFRVCACCDGVTLRSEMSIFDLKCMYQFIQDIFRFCV